MPIHHVWHYSALRNFLLLTCAVALALPAVVRADHTAQPAAVTVAGSLQSELGCPDDWQPDCAATQLAFDAIDDVWQGGFTVSAGNWEYKAPLNNAWDENYGAGAQANGANIALNLGADTDVKFYYSHETHWITDNFNSTIAVAPGSFQDELGCPGDWQPDCLRSWLQDPDGDSIYTFTAVLPGGYYEAKVAIDESWAENYGAGGVQNGPNVSFSVPGAYADMLFSFNDASKELSIAVAPPEPQPSSVTIAGDLQDELGCPGDWQPDCAATHLTFDADDTVWQGTFNLPAGNWNYKATIDDAWDENYGANAQRGGANIALSAAATADVRFYYSHETHWVTDNVNSLIATVPGSFQDELGCPGDWQPDCLRSWLQDPDGDGFYTFSAYLPAGNYEAKVAIDESWTVNYGDGGVPGGANIPFAVTEPVDEVFFTFDASTNILSVGTGPSAPKGNLAQATAHWVSEDVIAWNAGGPGDSFTLHHAADGGLALDGSGVIGADGSIELTHDAAGLSAEVLAKFPHLSSYSALRIDAADLSQVPLLLKGQLAISVADTDGNPVDATSLQIPGVLDDLFAHNGALGPVFAGGKPSVSVWAPTATDVSLVLFDDTDPASIGTDYPMAYDPETGTWRISGPADWRGKYYLFDVRVFAPSTGQIENNLVTDPYSLNLSMNSQRSQLVDLNDPALMPLGWSDAEKPPLAAPEDIVIYELHVRDFSVYDTSVPETLRGTYMAFAKPDSDGSRHLGTLADAGLTHIHLLPTFDIASIEEDKNQWQQPDPAALDLLPPDSDRQQAAVTETANLDGFNWGYDPWHYTTPEGSYSTDPNGTARVVEYRSMVKALNQTGLRVVMDVVYNHTASSGQNDKSVLDKIVPGYYHRLSLTGAIERSTCCENTASEHAMMEKLMVDSVLTWARDYRIDGFRFDLMGHHSKSTMLRIREALDSLTVESDGVDGASIYLYGEGWNFGEVANNARFEQATQRNLAGTGIGTFSDRLRDGVRGGNPFSDLRDQGFINGLGYDPNSFPQDDASSQLLHVSDWIRIGLAGDIADFEFVNSAGNTVRADEVDYFGQQAGYTADPQENITYAAAHDNETLFDATQLKTPTDTTMADRVRIQNLGNSIVMLGQGIPFIHAGQDILRSKSMDRDSFNSGDWFNAIDWTLETTNWGNGLPVAEKNQDKWPIMQPLLANPALAPQSSDVFHAAEQFHELLRIRGSSPLFRLQTADDVKQRVRFHNTGAQQIPGLIVMTVADEAGNVDLSNKMVVVLFNAGTDAVEFSAPATSGEFSLHPVQSESVDPIVRTATFDNSTKSFSVPARTTAVFLAMRPIEEQIEILIERIDLLEEDKRLNHGRANALRAKLRAALRSVARGTPAAVNQLRAFTHQVRAFVSAGILSDEEGGALIVPAVR